MIADEVPGTVYGRHGAGCGHVGEDKEQVIRNMTGFVNHPNVYGVVLVGNGCELITPEVIMDEVSKQGTPVKIEAVSVQTAGGTPGCLQKGKELAKKLMAEAAGLEREPCDVSDLMVGLECGGSDAFSGLTANPSVGVAADLLVNEGGTAIFTETTEMLGTEQVLARRAADPNVAQDIYHIIEAAEDKAKTAGVDIRGTQPSPGNIEGGLTSIEEKSLGCIRKGGTTTIQEVVKFAQMPSRRGLIIMDGTAADVQSNIALAAAGCQIIIFTTGRGTPVGTPTVPVIKVSSNTVTYSKMPDNIDVNAGVIIDGEGTLQSVGEQIFNEIVGVASGKLTKAETLGHREFDINFTLVV
jgi:altronate dehydratase large subunit